MQQLFFDIKIIGLLIKSSYCRNCIATWTFLFDTKIEKFLGEHFEKN